MITIPSTIAGIPTWILALVVLIVVVAALSTGRERSDYRGRRGYRRRTRGGRGISGLPILLVIGLLIGATAFGSNVIRTIITTVVHALTTLGGLYGG